MRRRSRALALIALGIALALAMGAGSATYSAFSKTTSNDSNTVTAKRVFPGVRVTTGWNIDDASSGTVAQKDDPLAFVDAITKNTGNFASSYSATRYVDVDLQGSRPASVPITGAQVNVTFSTNAAGDTGCFYFDLRRISDGSLIQTYGSAATTEAGGAVGCVTGTTLTTKTRAVTIPVADVNDLSIRIYGYESGAKLLKFDRITVTGTSLGDTWTMYEKRFGDRSTGTMTYTTWSLLAQDAVGYSTAANWAAAYAAARYLKVIFATDHVPSAAVVTSVSFIHRYSSAGTGNACVFYEVYSSSGTLLGTHGSSGSPYSCTNTTAITNTISLPELDTAAKVNGFYVKAYCWETSGKKTNNDWIEADVNYYVD